MKMQADVPVALELRAWARPGPDQTLDDLIARMEELGNEVVLVDRDNDRLELKLHDPPEES